MSISYKHAGALGKQRKPSRSLLPSRGVHANGGDDSQIKEMPPPRTRARSPRECPVLLADRLPGAHLGRGPGGVGPPPPKAPRAPFPVPAGCGEVSQLAGAAAFSCLCFPPLRMENEFRASLRRRPSNWKTCRTMCLVAWRRRGVTASPGCLCAPGGPRAALPSSWGPLPLLRWGDAA